MSSWSQRTSLTAPAYLETLSIAVCGLLADATEKVVAVMLDPASLDQILD